MKATWITRLYLATALSASLAQCLLVATANAEMMPIGMAHTLPSSDKVDLTCDANGDCAGSIKFGANYVLNSITCLAAAGEYFYGYADIR